MKMKIQNWQLGVILHVVHVYGTGVCMYTFEVPSGGCVPLHIPFAVFIVKLAIFGSVSLPSGRKWFTRRLHSWMFLCPGVIPTCCLCLFVVVIRITVAVKVFFPALWQRQFRSWFLFVSIGSRGCTSEIVFVLHSFAHKHVDPVTRTQEQNDTANN